MAAPPTSKAETGLVPAEGGTLVPPSPGELAANERVAGLKRRVQMIDENDDRIVSGIQRFKDIPGPGEPGYADVVRVLNEGSAQDLADLGFPGGIARGRKALRLALWGQVRKSDIPYGIVSANERHQARKKLQGKQGKGTTLNLTMVSIPAPKPPGPEERVVIVQKETSK